MDKPIMHRLAIVGKYKISSHLSGNEIHIEFKGPDIDNPITRPFKLEQIEDFHTCFDQLILLAKIQNTLNKKHYGNEKD